MNLKANKAISQANLLTRVKSKLPKLFNPLFRNQGGVNRSLIDALEAILEAQTKANAQIIEIQQNQSTAQIRFDNLNRYACKTALLFEQNKVRVSAELASLTANTAELAATKQAILAKLNAVDNQIQIGRHETSTEIRSLGDRTKINQDNQKANFETQLAQIRKECQYILETIDTQATKLQEKDAQLSSTIESVKKIISQVASKNAYAQRPATLEVSNKKGSSVETTMDSSDFDKFYQAFEDQFRGTRESVIEKQLRHLNTIKELTQIDETSSIQPLPVIDLGCGRGEWLELLVKEGISAIGVDQNRSFIEECRSRKLKAEESDVFTYLASLENNSCRAITAFHIVEHLSFPELWTFYQETLRVLAPGGIAIFETPNPNNLRVAANFFLTDITHVRPLPTSLAAFLAEYLGASKTEIHQYHPFPEAEKYKDLPMEVNDAIYGAQDYSVIFWK